LGFETTGPAGPAPYEEGVAGREYRFFLVWTVAVVALLWWWGVVFDLWIVVASISHTRRLRLGFLWFFWGFCGWGVVVCV
jgi:hypothetical protein